MPADPYSVLGVSKSASADDIKKAYRKLAHQHHPDKKGGNEAKFKEANEAYQTLSDPDKKARFDQFGHAGAGFGGAQGYQDFDFGGAGGGFESIFDMFTGGFGSAPQRHAQKGEDLHLEVGVTSADLGKRKVYEFQAFNACGTCDSSGVAPGSAMKECATCKGQGKVRSPVRTPFGTFAQVVECSVCEGEGKIPEKKCDACRGTGRLKGKRSLEVHLPKDIEDHYLLAFPKEGNAGPLGTPAGDLLVTLRMR